MRVDVIFGGANVAPSDVAGRVVAVIDVLRASTSITAAVMNGARAVLPFESSEDAVSRSKSFEKGEFLLAGERKMKPISGFDLGNSPLEYTREVVEGKTVLLTTTNGTPAITNTAGARDVVVASYVNFTVVLAMLRTALRGGTDITLICAGRDRQFGLEDAGCAGRFVAHMVKRLTNVIVNDAAQACVLIDKKFGDNIAKLFDASEHGQLLRTAGYVDDLAACAAIDSYPVIPLYQERQITMLGPDRSR
ncbi:MAG TPA: 2-phosphosulfolactate phosphatase [Gemmatimonadaceae bacterium]|jgi:2-phosphosulfolactate phosphatase